MIGTIETTSRHPQCGRHFKYDENRSDLLCPKHPDIQSHGPFKVRFGRQVSSKTRVNVKSCLHNFFCRLCDRENIRMPTLPECSFKLGWRDIIDIETRQAIIAEVYRISMELPGMPSFRHLPGRSGIAAGRKFGDRYLYKWWTRECKNLDWMRSESLPIVDFTLALATAP